MRRALHAHACAEAACCRLAAPSLPEGTRPPKACTPVCLYRAPMLWVLCPGKAVFERPMLWDSLLPKPCAPCLPSTRPFACSDGRAGEKFWISLKSTVPTVLYPRAAKRVCSPDTNGRPTYPFTCPSPDLIRLLRPLASRTLGGAGCQGAHAVQHFCRTSWHRPACCSSRAVCSSC